MIFPEIRKSGSEQEGVACAATLKRLLKSLLLPPHSGCIAAAKVLAFKCKQSFIIVPARLKIKTQEAVIMIKNGSLVRFEYTLCDDSGDVIQSNRGKDPVSYTHGQHEIIPGLEKGLNGMDVNDEKTIRVQPEEAYGPVDPNAFKEVPKTDVPAAALQVGTPLGTRGPNGEELVIHVREVKQETVVLDFNHPLAGKTLNFDVKVVDVESKAS
jgi:FKBP-type peptidyl-prolyl cis-trans isomerase SlyD